uniref:Uncharacterized protein n=1 Tax=Babesia orientalis TaxID=273649 RepID=B6EBK0_9APIC|nr:hypothetical protein [Babesia orientalis]
MRGMTNSEGHLDHSLIVPFLIGTSMEDISESNRERMVSCEEMTTLAIVWMKVLSEVYKQEETGVSVLCGGVCCGGSTSRVETDVVQTVANENTPSVSQSHATECDASVTINDAQYTVHVNDEQEEVQLAQKNVGNYIQTLVNEASQNRQKGVKCFVYSSDMTANGGCISAGAAVPQRRERTQSRRKTSAGCC